MTSFTIMIAGVAAEICCHWVQNKTFFRDYLSEASPVIRIAPTEADCCLAERQLFEQAERNGTPRTHVAPWVAENTAIHSILAAALIDYSVLLVHGSAVVVDGEAFVFMANSGTGKSTHTRLWREVFGGRAWMINDDKPMMKCTDDRVLVCGTPWDGKDHLSRNTAVPLRALVSLAHGETNVITPVSKGEGLASLYQHAYRPEKEDAVARVLQLETSIVSRTDCFRLACNMDPEAAIVAYAGITGNTSKIGNKLI